MEQDIEAERREQLKELCSEASSLPPNQRHSFLTQACQGDQELFSEIASLLSFAEDEKVVLDHTAWELLATELAHDETDTLIDRQIGRYKIKSLLGQGGMGKVFRAEDTILRRAVALKILRSNFTLDQADPGRFQQEARTISALRHPNIITIHEIGEQDNLRFLVTELIEGQTLREMIRVNDGLDWREVIGIAAQIAEALNAAHAAQIIHRDIKPENIMVEENGHVKVLDFGIAKRGVVAAANGNGSGLVEDNYQTIVGAITGTSNYMSPEQRRCETLDVQTDIFSFGLVLYEMLAGHRPYEGLSEAEKRTALLSNEEIPPIRGVCPNVPAALDNLLTRALHKDREKRCSAIEMVTQLRELRSFLEVSEQQEGQASLQIQNANRLLTQSITLFTTHTKRYIPLATLWTIWRHANLKYGRLEREVMKKSLLRGLAKYSQWGLLILAIAIGVGVIVARVISIESVWEEHLLRDGHAKWVHSIAFSPDGGWLVSGSEDNTVIIWDFAQRKRRKTLTDHTARVNAVAVSPNGKWFATGSNDQTVIVWDAVNLEKIITLREHRAAVNAVAFSLDGKWLASASSGDPVVGSDFRTVLWDTSRWQKAREVSHGVLYGPILFSPDSRLLVTNQLQWDLVSDKQIVNDELPPGKKWGGWNWAAFSPDAKFLVSANGDGSIVFQELVHSDDLTNSKPIQDIKAHQDFGRAVAFSPDGKLVATGTDVILLWDMATKKIISRFDDVSSVWSLAFSPEGRWLVSAHGDGSIQVRDLNDRRRAVDFDGHGDHVLVVVSSPNGKRIASAGKDGAVILWNAETEQKEAVLFGHKTRVVNLAFAPDGTWLASLDQDGGLIRWDLEKQAPQWSARVCSGTECLAISGDGKWIVIPCGIYESDGKSEIIRWNQEQTGITVADGAAFSPDGNSIAVVQGEKVLLFNTQTWQVRAKQAAALKLPRIQYSPDGRSVVTGSEDGTLIWWEANTLRKRAEVKAHKAAITALTFSSDGKTLASADKDEIFVWEASNQKRIATIGPQTAPVSALAFLRDSKRLIVAKRDRTVRMYTQHLMRWGKRLD